MKKFKKILVAAMSIAAIAMSTTAFAATTATYDKSSQTAALTLAEGDVSATSGQMTVVVVPKTFGASSEATEIYYINQEEFGTKFAEILANMGLKGDIDPAGYEVRIGGENMDSVATFAFKVDGGNIIWGDANGDGKVLENDAARILQYRVGREVEIDLTAADANGDGKVLENDAARILQYRVGRDVTLGPQTK